MPPCPPQRTRCRRLALEFLETRAVPTTALYANLDVGMLTNEHPFDVNNDDVVAPGDALIIMNALNNGEAGSLADHPDLLAAFPRIDVNGDGELAPNDALQIINFLNSAENDAATDGGSFVLPLSQIGMSSAAHLANGNVRISQFGTSVWDFDQKGTLAGQITVPFQAGQTVGSVTAISPNGRWLAGSQGSLDYSIGGAIVPGPAGLWDAQDSLAFRAIDLSSLPSVSGILAVSDSSVALIGVSGILTYRWDPAHGLTKLTSLADLSGGTLTGVPGAHGWAMSADGSIIVGESGDSNGPHFATQWTDPTKPKRLPDLGGDSEARSISLDGHIIGGTVFDPNQDVNVSGRPLAAVWVDGQLKILHDAQGNQLKGGVQRVVNGIDGDPNKWVAFGWMSSGSFIAFSGGQVQPLNDWLSQNYSIKLVDKQAIVGAFVDENRLSLVTYDHRILPLHPCSIGDQGLNCGPAFPPLPPEANRLITVDLRDSDFAPPPAVNAAEFALPLEQLGISSAGRLPNGKLRVTQNGDTVFDFDQSGNAAGQINVTLQSGQNAGPITAISPNGRWLAAFQAGLWDTQGSLHFDPTDFSTLPSQSWITAVSDPGTALISVNGVLSYQWDEVHGLVKLISLTETGAITGSGEPGSFAQAITPDGQTVVGFSGDRTSSFYATRWTAPDHPEHLPDLGAISAAYSVSADGRVIGGTVHDPNLHPTWGGTALAAVWIDGQLQLLRDAQGNTIEGVVQKVVNGFDGDPFKWIAIGHAAAGNFIAFSGGQTKWLSIWLAENYSLNQGFDDIVAAFIDGNELTIVGRDGTLSARSPFPYTGRELCSTPVYVPPPPGAANRMVTVALHEADFAAPIPANTSSPASGGEGETFASIDSLFALAADHDIRDRLRSISATPTN